MGNGFLDAPGSAADPQNLILPMAIQLASALRRGSIEYARFIETHSEERAEVVIFDVEVERPQLCVHPIRATERLAVVFFEDSDVTPEVLALRRDFPVVPHLNLREQELPRSLCLYEEPFRNLRRKWTPARFVGRIREWFALTAKGELHQDDQSLEPILMGSSGVVVLPDEVIESQNNETPLYLYCTEKTNHGYFFIARSEEPDSELPTIPFVTTVHRCDPQQHGVIRRRPKTLADLAALVLLVGVDLLAEIRNTLFKWRDKGHDILSAHLGLIVLFPKTRGTSSEVETIDSWVFIVETTIKGLGVSLGLWTESEGHVCPLIPHDTSNDGSSVLLEVLNPSLYLSRERAARLSGHAVNDKSLCAIGVGALGSQVIMNLARAGFGKWTLVDDDRLMPHNLVRHALDARFIGFSKARSLSLMANALTDSEPSFSPLPANILSPRENAEALAKTLNDSEIILDMSASIAVARHLVHAVESPARRMSLFMSPNGRDLVLLFEDSDRRLLLDQLEMQYYRAIMQDHRLDGHLGPPAGRYRYGQSCRDVSTLLPQYLFGLHAAIGSMEIRRVVQENSSQITIWRSKEDGSVERVKILPSAPVVHPFGEWTLFTDEDLIHHLSLLREEKLPNETGGVLLGSFDLQRRIVYVVDTIPSPPDSEEWPTLYIRGCRGLERDIERLSQATDGMIEYVGEWHSHPNGANTAPSQDDILVFSWLTERMSVEGLPALMAIVGAKGHMSCFLGKIVSAGNLLAVREEE